MNNRLGKAAERVISIAKEKPIDLPIKPNQLAHADDGDVVVGDGKSDTVGCLFQSNGWAVNRAPVISIGRERSVHRIADHPPRPQQPPSRNG